MERNEYKRAEIEKLRDEEQKKSDQYYHDYQITGSSSTRRTHQKHAQLVDVCNLALEGMSKSCWRCENRWENIRHIIEELKNRKQFDNSLMSIEEVIGLIESLY